MDSSHVTDPTQIVRPLANFSPSIWGDCFTSFSMDIQSINTDFKGLSLFVSDVLQAWEKDSKEVDGLKEEVRGMLVDAKDRPAMEAMNLINTLERLGVSYHFEEEIEEQLQQIFSNSSADTPVIEDFDLFTTAVTFRILRQHGYNISCDVFNKFKDCNGDLMEPLKSDPKGILGLYEAAHVRIHGEEFLDEALAFTTTLLESMATVASPSLAKQVMHALKQPLHKGIPRVEARHYITFYQEDPSKIELLLKFAKLDFNLVQLLHRQELSQILRWWNEEDIASKCCYARNRIVEGYLWPVATYFEPRYSLGRSLLAKTIALLSVTDDTFDAYGTLEELVLFTEAVQRWDIDAMKQLPDYMKVLYKAVLDFYEELQKEMMKQGKPYGPAYFKQSYQEIVRGYFTEAKWFRENYVPTFEEYMSNGLTTSANVVILISSLMDMDEIATIEAFNWAINKPRILIASNVVGRLIDDIMSHEEEQERGHVASGVECYMKQYNLSKGEVTNIFYEKMENAWKDMNEECLRPNQMPMFLLTRVVNLVRLLEVVYKTDDGYTHPKVLKDQIILLFTDPIPI